MIIVTGIYMVKLILLCKNATSDRNSNAPCSHLNQNEEVNEDNRPFFPIPFAEPVRNDQMGNGGSSENILQADVVMIS